MTKVEKIIIGIDEYTVHHNAVMGGTHLGSINQSAGEIKMRELSYDNKPLSKRMYYKVLMHEIVHGIDFNTMFVAEEKEGDDITNAENCIDLVTVFILRNFSEFVENREAIFDNFADYIEACEYKMERLSLMFYAILDFIDDNPELVNEFLEIYK